MDQCWIYIMNVGLITPYWNACDVLELNDSWLRTEWVFRHCLLPVCHRECYQNDCWFFSGRIWVVTMRGWICLNYWTISRLRQWSGQIRTKFFSIPGFNLFFMNFQCVNDTPRWSYKLCIKHMYVVSEIQNHTHMLHICYTYRNIYI